MGATRATLLPRTTKSGPQLALESQTALPRNPKILIQDVDRKIARTVSFGHPHPGLKFWEFSEWPASGCLTRRPISRLNSKEFQRLIGRQLKALLVDAC